MIRWRIILKGLPEVKGLLKLIQIEFLKLCRRKFVWLMLLSAFFMPLLALVAFRNETGIEPIRFYNWTVFSHTSWIILPVVLGMLCTMLIYDENQYHLLGQLWIVPVSKMRYFFSKFVVILIYSICFMLITAASSVTLGVLADFITFEWEITFLILKKCLETGILTAFAMLPVLTVAAVQEGYILPVCTTLIYVFSGFIFLMVNMYLHPLSSVAVIIDHDIPGVVFRQAVSMKSAFLCIGVWDCVSVFGTYTALVKKKVR